MSNRRRTKADRDARKHGNRCRSCKHKHDMLRKGDTLVCPHCGAVQ